MANDELYNLCVMLVFFVLYSIWVSMVFGFEARDKKEQIKLEDYFIHQPLRR